MKFNKRHAKKHQSGAILLIAMIFMLIFAAIAAASLSGTLSASKSITNMQWRNEAIAVANDALNKILSGTRFATDPNGLVANVNAANAVSADLSGSGIAVYLAYDMNSDGENDIRITFPEVTFDGTAKTGPRCVKKAIVKMSTLSTTSPADTGCFGTSLSDSTGLGSVDVNGNVTTSVGSQSICANTEWMIPVHAQDDVTTTSVDVMTGVSVRVLRTDAENACD